jgi:tungstate transport system ATP-binding protein
MPLYELHNVSHEYDGRTVLNIDHWQVDADRVTGVVGPNGSGKSTLLSLLGFIEVPSHGEILFDGQNTVPFADNIRGKVTFLPQDALLLKRTVYGNIAYGLRSNKIDGDERQHVHDALKMVGLDPESFARRPWFALSGGEIQRVALAARLALQPRVLLLDEPTNSVDAASARRIKAAALHARQQWGTTLVVASHDMAWLADMCDSVLHLFRGRILGAGQHTLVFGPWQAGDRGCVARSLTADQVFVAKSPRDPNNGAVAALPADKANLLSDVGLAPDGNHCVQGLLLHLNYEKTNRQINAAVLVGDTVLTVYLSKQEMSVCRYTPGQRVWVGYDPQAVGWF